MVCPRCFRLQSAGFGLWLSLTLLSNASYQKSAAYVVLPLLEITLLSNMSCGAGFMSGVLPLLEITLLSNNFTLWLPLISVLPLLEITLLSNLDSAMLAERWSFTTT